MAQKLDTQWKRIFWLKAFRAALRGGAVNAHQAISLADTGLDAYLTRFPPGLEEQLL